MIATHTKRELLSLAEVLGIAVSALQIESLGGCSVDFGDGNNSAVSLIPVVFFALVGFQVDKRIAKNVPVNNFQSGARLGCSECSGRAPCNRGP